MNNKVNENGLEIAVVGMSGKFPGADNLEEFWNNLKNEEESISYFSDEELEKSGIEKEIYSNTNYIKAKPYLKNGNLFDEKFFGYSPKEAKLMDPQVRLMHETVWHALENANCNPDEYSGLVGLYVGSSNQLPWMENHLSKLQDNEDTFQIMSLNSPSFASRISYKLNLKGPSLTIQTACSTSLVAIHTACQGLLGGECDTAIAGGVSLIHPRISGYQYQDGMIFSRDGHCRPFDNNAKGTVFGEGVGAVVLKRLQDAKEDGDFIYSVIKGSAVNNDGNTKAGYTAPSVSGQASVIKSAIEISEVEPETISYVEAHGTGTEVGDPIEVEALKKAFNTERKEFCRIGSVKSNIGHLDAASGIAGFIKTVLMLYNGEQVSMPNFETPNKHIKFEQTPFYIDDFNGKWIVEDVPKRAGISSFGIGGTNAHIILEEKPLPPKNRDLENKNDRLVCLSANTKNELLDTIKNLEVYLRGRNDIYLEDISNSLIIGRKKFRYRKVFVAHSTDDLIQKLSDVDIKDVNEEITDKKNVDFVLRGFSNDGFMHYLDRYRTNIDYKEIVENYLDSIQSIIPISKKDFLSAIESEDKQIKELSMMIMSVSFVQELNNLSVVPKQWIVAGNGIWTALYSLNIISLSEVARIIYNPNDGIINDVQRKIKHNYSYNNIIIYEKDLKELNKSYEMHDVKHLFHIVESDYDYEKKKDNKIKLDFSMNQGILLKTKARKIIQNHDISALQLLGTLWENGLDNSLLSLKDKKVSLVTLPGYPFKKSDFSSSIRDVSRKRIEKQNNNNNKSTIKDEVYDIVKNHFEFPNTNSGTPFFDMGATSLDITQIATKISEKLNVKIDTIKLYKFPTIEKLSEHLSQDKKTDFNTEKDLSKPLSKSQNSEDDIAIIGMSGRIPNSKTFEEFWNHLLEGKDLIHHFTQNELEEKGISSELYKNPDFVSAKGILDNIENFDAEFFGYSAREVELMDPQLRLLHECAWEALEDAAIDPERTKDKIGVYTGTSPNHSWINRFSNNMSSTEQFSAMLLNDREFFSTQLSYKLDLHGPSVTMQTACSTSLVNIAIANKSLLNHDCDVALAGGITVSSPNSVGYMYQDGMIQSKDGYCRPFDEEGSGTVFGDGAGIVTLKRYKDAKRDGNPIHAVIKAVEINNDGSRKVGYTAPSVEGQAEVLKNTYKRNNINPDNIDYIETHGTATRMGDPIEIEALSTLFHENNEKSIAIGSVKSNLGHLNSAAGIVGLFKTIMSMKNETIPPTINYEKPNKEINFKNTPFYINTNPIYWKSNEKPRMAGISSFGIGGTNAHIVIQEEKKQIENKKANQSNLLLLSARTENSLQEITDNIKKFIINNPEIPVESIANTLSKGRKQFDYRKSLVLSSSKDLEEDNYIETKAFKGKNKDGIIFMFPGQGSQYSNMMKDLYDNEPVFRRELDYCFTFIIENYEIDLKNIVNSEQENINETQYTQVILFIYEYSMAKFLEKCGVKPNYMIGHSIGEYVAACLADVFSLESAIDIVIARGKLMQNLQSGSMLSVQATEDFLVTRIGENISIAAVNAENSCVLSGEHEYIHEIEKTLKNEGIATSLLKTSHAFHSHMMEGILEEFKEVLQKHEFKEPQIPFLSNVTGDWIQTKDAINVSYWVNHIRSTVRFNDELTTLFELNNLSFIEVGPGNTLTSLIKKHKDKDDNYVINLVRHPQEQVDDYKYFLKKIGELWSNGHEVTIENRNELYYNQMVSLPTYPFERKKYWIEEQESMCSTNDKKLVKKEMKDWFYLPSWEHSPKNLNNLERKDKNTWLVLNNNSKNHKLLMDGLIELGDNIISVIQGNEYEENEETFTINPSKIEHYNKLMNTLSQKNINITNVLHLWECSNDEESILTSEDHIINGYYSLIFLSQSIANQKEISSCTIYVVTTNMHLVTGNEIIHPEKSLLLGPCKVIPQEYNHIKCSNIDIDYSSDIPIWKTKESIQLILKEIYSSEIEQIVAYRNRKRWIQSYKEINLEQENNTLEKIEKGGVYLLVGGLGNIGTILSKTLAKEKNTHLYITGRSELPPRIEWGYYINERQSEENSIVNKIKTILMLEKLGATVNFISADASDFEEMNNVIERIYSEHNKLNGVFYAAGLPGNSSFRPINEIVNVEIEEQFNSKIQGLNILEEVLIGTEIDFCLVFSSISSILGGLGFSAYSAANIYIDSFILNKNKNAKNPWICVNWEAWNFWGDLENNVGESIDALAILPEEGETLFNYILSSASYRHVLVSTGDITNRINQWLFLNEEKDETHRGVKNERPELDSDFIEPRDKIEKTLCKIWGDFMGLEKVGINDNFFDLGASSLDIVQVTNIINKSLKTNVAVVTLFTYPTISELVKYIKEDNDNYKYKEEEEKEKIEKSDKRLRNRKQREKKLKGGVDND